MSSVVNLLKVGPNTIKPSYRTHRRPIEAERDRPKSQRQEDMTDEEFIEHMKANPRSWGKEIPQYNAYPMRKGWISIYHRDGDFSKSLYFANNTQKMEKIKEAMRSIRNLPGSYIEIAYEK